MDRKAIAIVAAKFNFKVVASMVQGAKEHLESKGIQFEDKYYFEVPGAYELPWACQQLAQTKRYDGIIALGAVIRGETAHFDYVAGPCASGILDVSLKYDLQKNHHVLFSGEPI